MRHGQSFFAEIPYGKPLEWASDLQSSAYQLEIMSGGEVRCTGATRDRAPWLILPYLIGDSAVTHKALHEPSLVVAPEHLATQLRDIGHPHAEQQKLRETVEQEMCVASPEQAATMRQLLNVIERGHDNDLKPFGIDLNDAWLSDIVEVIASHKPLIVHAGSLKGDLVDTARGPHYEITHATHLPIAKLLGPLITRGMLSFNLDDMSLSTGMPIDLFGRSMLHGRAMGILECAGIIPPRAQPGQSYQLRSAGNTYAYARTQLYTRFGRDIGWGVLKVHQHGPDEGAITFQLRPDWRGVGVNGLQGSDEPHVLLRQPLRTGGGLTRTGLILADHYNSQQADYMHLHVADESERQSYEDARRLLVLQDAQYGHHFRTMFIDSSKVSEAMAAYALSKRLERAVSRVGHALQAYVGATYMQLSEARQYLLEEFGADITTKNEHGIVADDQAIIECFTNLAEALFPDGVRSVAAPAWGQYSYLGQALAAHLTPDGVIKATDIAGANLTMATLLREGTAARKTASGVMPDYEALAIGPKFERVLTLVGGERYKGSYDRLCCPGVLSIEHRDMFTAPTEQSQVLLDSFGSYAVCWSKGQLARLIGNHFQGLNDDPDATAIATYVTKTDSWRRFPAVYLTKEDIYQAYMNAGFAEVQLYVMPSDGKFRHDYEEMLLVLARKNGAKPLPSPREGLWVPPKDLVVRD